MLLTSKMLRLVQYVVKFAILGSGQECGDLCLSVEQDGTYRKPRVPHGDLAARHRGQLHAGPVGITVLALLPANVAEFARWHAVVHRDHPYPLPTVLTRPGSRAGFTGGDVEFASGEPVPGYVSTVC